MRTELSYDNAIYWANRQHDILQQQAALEMKINALEYTLDRREKDVLGDVTAAKDSDGKHLFSNELARKAELARRLELDPEYHRTKAEANMLIKENLHLQREAKYAGRVVEIMCTFARKEHEPMIPVPASMLASLSRRDDSHKIMVRVPDISSNPFADHEDPAA